MRSLFQQFQPFQPLASPTFILPRHAGVKQEGLNSSAPLRAGSA